MHLLAGRSKPAHTLLFSADSRYLAAGGPGGVHVWEPVAGPDAVPAVFQPRTGHPPPLAWSHVVAALADGRFLVFLWRTLARLDPRTGRTAAVAPELAANLFPVQISPDGRWAAAGYGGYGQNLRFWKLGARDATLLWQTTGGRAPAFPVVGFFPDGKRIAVAGRIVTEPPACQIEGRLALSDAMTGKRVEQVRSHLTAPERVRVSPDGTTVLVQAGAWLAAWDADDLAAKPRKAANPGRTKVRGVAYHPSGRRVATVGDHTARLWDADTLTEVAALDWKIGKLTAVALSPDGTLAAAGSESGKIVVWDVDG